MRHEGTRTGRISEHQQPDFQKLPDQEAREQRAREMDAVTKMLLGDTLDRQAQDGSVDEARLRDRVRAALGAAYEEGKKDGAAQERTDWMAAWAAGDRTNGGTA